MLSDGKVGNVKKMEKLRQVFRLQLFLKTVLN